MLTLKSVALLLAVVGSASVVYPLCVTALSAASSAGLQGIAAAAQVQDTATARIHISGMTCATCPATARVALKKVSGVFRATVTLDDSLGVVWYDPRRVTPEQIAAHLTKLTGYKAALLSDSTKLRRTSGA